MARPFLYRGNVRPHGNGPFLEGKDRDHEACRSLWVAVIQKAIKDMAYARAKSLQLQLTPSEREKLQRIYELEAPESFFKSNWFEEICLYLELSPSRIRTAVLDRFQVTSEHSTVFTL